MRVAQPHLHMVGLDKLMLLSEGSSGLRIAVIDGPVSSQIPALKGKTFTSLKSGQSFCRLHESAGCMHGTFVASMLFAARDCELPGICPGATALIHPIFGEASGKRPGVRTDLTSLADAIETCLNAKAAILNLSVSLAAAGSGSSSRLVALLNRAAREGRFVVAAAGNESRMSASSLTQHPWVIPVVGCDLSGRPTPETNLSASMSRSGLRVPADDIPSFDGRGEVIRGAGTSAAVPLVVGALALLKSLVPGGSPAALRQALGIGVSRPTAVLPPLLNAWQAYLTLRAGSNRTISRKQEVRA